MVGFFDKGACACPEYIKSLFRFRRRVKRQETAEKPVDIPVELSKEARGSIGFVSSRHSNTGLGSKSRRKGSGRSEEPDVEDGIAAQEYDWDCRVGGLRILKTYVVTHHRDALVVGDGANGTGTVSPNAGNLRFHVLGIVWEATSEIFDRFLGSAE